MKKTVNNTNHGSVKLIEVKNKIKCYTADSVNKKICKMQDKIDFLIGQSMRLKRIESEYKLWKDVLGGSSRWGIKKLLEDDENANKN